MLNFDEARAARQKVIEALSTPEFGEIDIGVGIALPETLDEADSGYKIAVRVADPDVQQTVLNRVAEVVDRDNEVDSRVVGQPRIISPSRYDAPPPDGPLAIGMSIQRQDHRAGTLGFFARIKNDLGFVSCNHVLTDPDFFHIGEPIFRTGITVAIGKLRHVAALTGSGRKAADCAFARVEPDQFPQRPGLLPDGTAISPVPRRVRRGLPVIKFGRTTPVSEGKIVACRMWRRILYPPRGDSPGIAVLFQDVFEIESTKKDPNFNEIMAFSDPGDSGSLICTNFEGRPRQPIGLLFAETGAGGPDNSGVAYANPITRVINALFLDEIKA